MGAGKTALALQMNYNLLLRQLKGIIICFKEGARGNGTISSRVGIEADAIMVNRGTDFISLIYSPEYVGLNYIIVDEVQFATKTQIEQLGILVDKNDINIYAFGLLSTHEGVLFEGTAALMVYADSVERLQVLTLCYCGKKAQYNARITPKQTTDMGQKSNIITSQESSPGVPGDLFFPAPGSREPTEPYYVALCRKHFYELKTKKN